VPRSDVADHASQVADEDTEYSAKLALRALEDIHRPFLVPVRTDTLETITSIRADCIINLIEWTGVDLPYSVQATKMIDRLEIPYTGADPANYEMMSDKILMKNALTSEGLPTPEYQVFTTGDEEIRLDLPFPLIVKLAKEHCSIGLSHDSIVQSQEQLASVVKLRLAQYHQPIIAEEFIEGREFQVTVLDMGRGLMVLPPAEIAFRSPQTLSFLTFESRWDSTHPDYKESDIFAANIFSELTKSIITVSKAAFKKLHFRDYTRLDMRVRDDVPYILEANANPGLDDNDGYGMTLSCRAAGISFRQMLEIIIESALLRAETTMSLPVIA
jgi:D-alanine-D-alanine ligase